MTSDGNVVVLKLLVKTLSEFVEVRDSTLYYHSLDLNFPKFSDSTPILLLFKFISYVPNRIFFFEKQVTRTVDSYRPSFLPSFQIEGWGRGFNF